MVPVAYPMGNSTVGLILGHLSEQVAKNVALGDAIRVRILCCLAFLVKVKSKVSALCCITAEMFQIWSDLNHFLAGRLGIS